MNDSTEEVVKEIDISEYLDKELVEQSRYKIEQSREAEYKGIENFIVKNVDIFTKLREEMQKDHYLDKFAYELEDYRGFPRGFFREKGIFYCYDINDLVVKYDFVKHSELFQINNDAYTDRYMFPLCLPNGDVFIHMGYCPPQEDGMNIAKYKMGDPDWIDQGNILGNMESLAKYPNKKVIYLAEGMTDAYRAEDVFKAPALAILGSGMTDTKHDILMMLREEGYYFIYIPDLDEAGQNEFIMNDKLIDNYLIYPKTLEGGYTYKDFDKFVYNYYVKYIQEHHSELNVNTPPEKTPVSVLPTEVLLKLNEEVKILTSCRTKKKPLPKSGSNSFNQLLSSLGVKIGVR